MLNVVDKDTDVLFYNVFGVVQLRKDQVSVAATTIRAGRPQARELTVDFDQPLKNFGAGFIIPFGAWIDRDDVHIGYGKLADYDLEIFRMNMTVIDKIVKETVGSLRGALS